MRRTLCNGGPQRPELGLVRVGVTKVRAPGVADSEPMEPQHIHDTHHGHGGTEEVRPLVDTRPHEKPAVAPALYAQLLWRGHAEAYELLPGTDEVVKDVLLLVQGTVLVPLFAVP